MSDPTFTKLEDLLAWDDEQCRCGQLARYAGELGARHLPALIARIKRVRAAHVHLLEGL